MQIMNTKKATADRFGSKYGGSQRSGLLTILLAAAVLIAVSIGGQPALAFDELRLTGIVKTIDPKTNLVLMDVQSESCPGIRRFRADDLGALGRYMNQAITFYIDSSTCRDTAIHTILVSRGIK
jgi:hypothetical protein